MRSQRYFNFLFILPSSFFFFWIFNSLTLPSDPTYLVTTPPIFLNPTTFPKTETDCILCLSIPLLSVLLDSIVLILSGSYFNIKQLVLDPLMCLYSTLSLHNPTFIPPLRLSKYRYWWLLWFLIEWILWGGSFFSYGSPPLSFTGSYSYHFCLSMR